MINSELKARILGIIHANSDSVLISSIIFYCPIIVITKTRVVIWTNFTHSILKFIWQSKYFKDNSELIINEI